MCANVLCEVISNSSKFSYLLVGASSPDALRFLEAFLSLPPRYLQPVKQAASCFALTEYLACISFA